MPGLALYYLFHSYVLFFLTFVIKVADDGSDGPKHVAQCCIALKCCV